MAKEFFKIFAMSALNYHSIKEIIDRFIV